MRRLILISLLLSLHLIIFSQEQDRKQDKKQEQKQDKQIKRGNALYSSYSYDRSIRKYEAIEKKDIDIKRKLAVSYYNIGDYAKSKEYWHQVVEEEGHKAEDIYNYASVLAINEDYEESEKWMQKFYALNKTDSRAKSRLVNTGFYKILQKNKGIFIINNLDINSKQQDFGTSYYLDDIAYASSRERRARVIKRIWNWNRLPFLDIYVGKPDSSLQINSVSKLRAKVNKRFHEGPVAFNKAGDFMVYTRNNYDNKSSDNIVKLQLFSSEKKKDKWQKPKSFSFNSREYSVGHASLTASGDTMYFASDMPGGIGGTDIYVSYRNQDGSWTKPHNLGKTINTEGNEMFPFIHSSGALFFASNGHAGLGGLDVFVSNIMNGEYSKPENLRVPVNSSYDDFAFVLNDAQTSGYFSSNRPGGKGDDDIYSFRMLKPLRAKNYLRGRSLDNNDVILAGTNVYLISEIGDTLARTVTGEDGKYEFEVEGGKSYKLVGTKTPYTDGVETFTIDKSQEVTEVDVILRKEPKFLLQVYVTDATTGNPIEGVQVDILDKVSQNTDKLYTASTGDVKKQLADKKMQDNLQFNISLSKDGYIPKDELWQHLVDHEGVYEVRISMEAIHLPVIYFDYNKSNIRRDASRDLNKVVDIMNKYPNIVIELSSHTDCRGTERYNERLSDRRAKSSANYIKQRLNNNPERIYGKGYGETRLVNDCACEGSQRCNCSEEEHQLNRRTEFVIIRFK